MAVEVSEVRWMKMREYIEWEKKVRNVVRGVLVFKVFRVREEWRKIREVGVIESKGRSEF